MPTNGQTRTLPSQKATPPPGRRGWRAIVAAQWNATWAEGSPVHRLWDDLRQAPIRGWHGMAHWIKGVIAGVGFSLVVLVLYGAGAVLWSLFTRLLTAAPQVQVGDDTSSGVRAVIDRPVRAYLAAGSQGLTVSASTLYAMWQLTGLAALILGFLTRSNAMRLTWTVWGAATIGMVWAASPDGARTVATAVAVLAWTLTSTIALRGVRLRRRVTIYNEGPNIRHEIVIPTPTSAGPDRHRD
ncbi:hypothetical protein ACFV3E_36675 [Streptomyces sp. NPDC059718]